MQLLHILVFCIHHVIFVTLHCSCSYGDEESGTAEIINDSIDYSPSLGTGLSLKTIWTHRIPSLNETDMAQQSADMEELTALAHSFDEEFKSLEEVVKSEWDDPRMIEKVTDGMRESAESVKKIGLKKHSMDYLLQRMIQKVNKSVSNIIETVFSVVRKLDVFRQSRRTVEPIGGEIYTEWLNGVDSDLIYLCKGYAYGDSEQREEITSHLARIVEILKKMSVQNETSDLREIIHSRDVVVSAFVESIVSGTLVNEITKSDLNRASNVTGEHENNTSENDSYIILIDGRIEFLRDVIKDTENSFRDSQAHQNASWDQLARTETKIEAYEVFHLVNVIGLENISYETNESIRRVRKILEEIDQGYKNGDGNAWAEHVKTYFEHLKQTGIIETNYRDLSKQYSLINSVINILTRQMLASDLQGGLEIELESVLTNATAFQEDVIRAIEELSDSQKIIYEDPQRTERLNYQMNEIEQDIEELFLIVNYYGSSNVVEGIKNKTLSVLAEIQGMALRYLPEGVLKKIHSVNDYLISLISSARKLDRLERENEALQKTLGELKIRMADINVEFRKTQLEFDNGEKNSNEIRTQATNLFVRLSNLRTLDNVPQYLFNEIVRMEDNILRFILKLSSSIQTQDYDSDEIFEEYITKFKNNFQEVKKNVTEYSNDWNVLQKSLFNVELIKSGTGILIAVYQSQKCAKKRYGKDVMIGKFYKELNDLRIEILSKITKTKNLFFACDPSQIDSKPDKLAVELVNYFEHRFKTIQEKAINNSLDLKSTQKIVLEIKLLAEQLESSNTSKFLPDQLRNRMNELFGNIDAYKSKLEIKFEEDTMANETTTDDDTLMGEVLNNFDIRLVELQQDIYNQKYSWVHLRRVDFELDTILQRANILKNKVNLSTEVQKRVKNFTNAILHFKSEITNQINALESADAQYIENITKKREELTLVKVNYFDTFLKQLKESAISHEENWFFIIKLEYMTEKLVYEVKVLQVTGQHSIELEERIKRLLGDAKTFKNSLELMVKELVKNNIITNNSGCRFFALSYQKIILKDLQKILSSLRKIIKDSSERTNIQMTFLEESLSNLTLDEHSLMEIVNTEHKNYIASSNLSMYDDIIESLRTNITQYEEEYYRIIGSSPWIVDNVALTAVIQNLTEADSGLEGLSRIDAPEEVKAKVKILDIRVKTILQSEATRTTGKSMWSAL